MQIMHNDQDLLHATAATRGGGMNTKIESAWRVNSGEENSPADLPSTCKFDALDSSL